MAEKRTRVWTCLVYPESAGDDWIQRLDDAHVPAFVSPLHDMDVDADTGEIKKPHHHVLLNFSGVKSESQAREVAESFGAANGHVERVNDARAMARYLCHLDEPEGGTKVRYNPSDVQCFGGADYSEMIDLSADDRARLIHEMMLWCQEQGVTEISDLMLWAGQNRWDWYRVLVTTQASTVMNVFIRSLRHRPQ